MAPTRIRSRLEDARAHLEGAHDDPGRVGLAYAQVVLALDELDAHEAELAERAMRFVDRSAEDAAQARIFFLDDAQREELRKACERAAARMRSVNVEP